MLKKHSLKSNKLAIIVLLLFICLFSVEIENKVFAAEEGKDWFTNGSNNKTSPINFDGYTKMASTLLIVLALMIGTVYVIKRKYGIKTNIGRGRKRLHVIDHISLGVKKTVFLVKVPGKHLLIGATNERIELITEIANEDIGDNEAIADESLNKNDFLSLIKKSYFEQKQK